MVAWQEPAAFLQNTLSAMGLTPTEHNESIVYWLPRMEQNPYNLTHFAGDERRRAAIRVPCAYARSPGSPTIPRTRMSNS